VEGMTSLVPAILCCVLAAAAMWALVWGIWPSRDASDPSSDGPAAPDATSQAPGPRRILFNRAAPISSRLLSQSNQSLLETRLLMMGAADIFASDIVSMMLLSAAFFGIFSGLLAQAFGFSLFLVVLGLLIGLGLPVYWLESRIRRRHEAIGRAMPFNLDLLTLSVEAGQDFGAAVKTVVERGIAGPFSEELAIVLREMLMGKTREEALRNLGSRVAYAPLSQFVSSLIQADQMGTSLGKVLRIQSSQLRQHRFQRAERLANVAPVKMLFPLILFIFPTVFAVIFGPIAYSCSGGF